MVGSVEHALDAKGRYSVPAKFRTALGEDFMAVPGTEPCILLYPAARWEALAERIAELPEFDAEAQEVRRFYGPDTERLKVDSQWRVVLPGRLKALAGLERGIVTVGAITRCEIWDRSTYAKYHSEIRAPERVARVQQKYRL